MTTTEQRLQTGTNREGIDLTDEELRCTYCREVIHVGMHYLRATIFTDTARVTAVQYPEDFPPEIAGPFCCPLHLMNAILDSPELKSTFGQ